MYSHHRMTTLKTTLAEITTSKFKYVKTLVLSALYETNLLSSMHVGCVEIINNLVVK